MCDARPLRRGRDRRGRGRDRQPGGRRGQALKALTDAPVHKGATSQDAVDTAAMLVAKRALVPLLHDLHAAADAAAQLAETHRDTPIIGRTLLQQAEPTTFGLKAAGWMLGLDEAADDARAACRLAVQLGGPVGTLAGRRRVAVVSASRATSASTRRVSPGTRCAAAIGELAGALGVAAGRGRQGRARRHAARPDRGRRGAREPRRRLDEHAAQAQPGRRDRPRSAAPSRRPGLVATLLAAMVQEHERAAGAWHSEWRPLTELLTATGSAASWLRTSLEGLEVDADADAREPRRRRPTRAPPPRTRRQSTGAPMIPHHLVTGPEDAPTLVLSNSLGTTLQMWDPQATRWPSASALVRYDTRGHGESRHAARPVLDRGRRPRRDRPARPPRRRARALRRALARRDDRPCGSAINAPERDRPARAAVHLAEDGPAARCGSTARRPCASRAREAIVDGTLRALAHRGLPREPRHRGLREMFVGVSDEGYAQLLLDHRADGPDRRAAARSGAHAGDRRRAGPGDAARGARASDRRRRSPARAWRSSTPART